MKSLNTVFSAHISWWPQAILARVIAKNDKRKLTMSEEPNEQEIRECAYKLWQKAGSPEGEETDFWHKAKDLITKHKGDADVDAASEESFPASDAVNHM